MIDLTILTGYIATGLSSVYLIPEVRRAMETHHLKDVSWGMLVLMFISSGLWLWYGVMLKDIPLAFSPCVNLILEAALMVLKQHYDHHRHPVREPHFAHCKKIAPKGQTAEIIFGAAQKIA